MIKIAVIGVGTMGAGIIELALRAGHIVYAYDAHYPTLTRVSDKLTKNFNLLIDKGKMDKNQCDECLARLNICTNLSDITNADLIIEAIIEDKNHKIHLIKQCNDILNDKHLFCSNTSALSLPELGQYYKYPENFCGLHFFNPAQVMKLVEIVPINDAQSDHVHLLHQLMRQWGKIAVVAQATPGFIVNRIARPYYADALMIIEDKYNSPYEIDTAMQMVGFKMGPCVLMDAIGHDVNYAVTFGMYQSFYNDPRFIPSLVQKKLVDGGRLGKKSQFGFYDYRTDDGKLPLNKPAPYLHELQQIENAQQTNGLTANHMAKTLQNQNLCIYDWAINQRVATISFPDAADSEYKSMVLSKLSALPIISKAPGLIIARTMAMIINEATYCVGQGVCSAEDVELAMIHGTNYPVAPFAMLNIVGVDAVKTLLDNLQQFYGSARYRISPYLQEQ